VPARSATSAGAGTVKTFPGAPLTFGTESREDHPVDTTALVVGLIGGGTIGSVTTAWLTTSHERRQAFRDRATEAGARFLDEKDKAVAAIVRLRGLNERRRHAERVSNELTHDFLTFAQPFVDAAKAKGLAHPGSLPDDEEDPIDAATRALHAVADFSRARTMAAGDLISAKEAVDAVERVLPALGTLGGPFQEFGVKLREALAAIRLATLASEALDKGINEAAAGGNAVRASKDRLIVVMAGESPEIATSAAAIVAAVRKAAGGAIEDAIHERDAFSDDEVHASLAYLPEASTTFAEEMGRSVKIRRRWRDLIP